MRYTPNHKSSCPYLCHECIKPTNGKAPQDPAPTSLGPGQIQVLFMNQTDSFHELLQKLNLHHFKKSRLCHFRRETTLTEVLKYSYLKIFTTPFHSKNIGPYYITAQSYIYLSSKHAKFFLEISFVIFWEL